MLPTYEGYLSITSHDSHFLIKNIYVKRIFGSHHLWALLNTSKTAKNEWGVISSSQKLYHSQTLLH